MRFFFLIIFILSGQVTFVYSQNTTEDTKVDSKSEFTFMSGLIKLEGGVIHDAGYISLSGGAWSPGFMRTKGLWIGSAGLGVLVNEKKFLLEPNVSIDYIPYWDFTSFYTRVTFGAPVQNHKVDFSINPQVGIVSLAGIAYATIGYNFILTENTLFPSRGLNFSIGLNIPTASPAKISYMMTFKEPYKPTEKKHL